ncbi:hypothetical protein BDW74DRAFT_180079 [Aspergillus multicolor]|uniref:uncharacterized protein n=1 Tax=Aspergillus multicolor TaxID=41759 RepID=UPI003CCE41DA
MKFNTVASIICLVASAAAFEYPDFVPLNKRQEPGTPQYECHANCGGIITASRSDGYCDTGDFKSMLNDCLNCALEYDIWKYYGNSVSSAAENCRLDATPVQPSSSSATATATSTSTETEAESTSTSTESGTETETASSTETTADSTTVSSTPVIPAATATTTPTSSEGATSSTPTTSDPEFTGGATSNAPAGLFMGGLVGSFVAALMV